MKKNCLLSVIVPVYNTCKYLGRCLDSLCVQTCDQIQVVIVDDGSSDGSGEICDEYAKKYENVLVIHKKNQGLVSARKTGIQSSGGRYIAFIDSDDWIDADFFKKIINQISNASIDIIAFDCLKEYEGKTVRWSNMIEPGEYCGKELDLIKGTSVFLEEEFVPWVVLPNLWAKIIDKGLVEKYISNVSDLTTFGEDAACFYPCLWNCNKLLVIDEAPYHYVQRVSSMSNSFDKIDTKIIEGISNCLLKSDYMNDHIRDQIRLYTFYLFMLRNYSYLDKYGFVLFPFEQIKPNDKIIIYGAGGFGVSLWDYINCTKCVQLQAIVDKRGNECSTADYEVKEINVIDKLDYDYIIIAILNEKMSKQVSKSLSDMGVELKKILYIKEEILK